MFIRAINFLNTNPKIQKNSNFNKYYASKPYGLQSDTLSLSFKGLNIPKKNPDEYQHIVVELLNKIPAHIKQRIEPKIENIMISESLAKALDIEIKANDSKLYESLSEPLMQFADLLRETLPQIHLQMIEAIASDVKSFDALPVGKSQLLLQDLSSEEQSTSGVQKAVTLYSHSSDGREITLPEDVTNILLMIKDMNLKEHQKVAFLKSLTGVTDDSELKGFAQADNAREVNALKEAEEKGAFAAIGMGKDKYNLYISTNEGEASFDEVRESVAKSFATLIVRDYSLDYNRDVAASFDRDVRVHNTQRAISDKLKQSLDKPLETLREMLESLQITPGLSSNPESKIGITQALTDVVTNLIWGLNRHDSSDKNLIGQMYPTLSKSVAKEIGLDFNLLQTQTVKKLIAD